MSGIGQQDTSSAADEWLSLEQLAKELGVTAWIDEGKDIPHLWLGPGPGDVRFRRSEIAPPLRAHQDGLH